MGPLSRSRAGSLRNYIGTEALTMETTVRLISMVAAFAVFLVLLAGLWNMTRGTSPNLSQKLMRWRVGLQFLVIVIGMLLVYFWRT
jgi:Mg2+ and Co2+ transporter CorA